MRAVLSLVGVVTTGLLVASCNPPPLKIPAKQAEACHCTPGNAATAATAPNSGPTNTAAPAKTKHMAGTETHAHHAAQSVADTESDEGGSQDESASDESATPRRHHVMRERSAYRGYSGSSHAYRGSSHDGSGSYDGHSGNGYITYDEFLRRGDTVDGRGYTGSQRAMPSPSYSEHSSYNAPPAYSEHSSYDERAPAAPAPTYSTGASYGERSYASATPGYADRSYGDRSNYGVRDKWLDFSASSYAYRSTSRVYQYGGGDDDYAGGSGDEGGWRDGYGRWHARTHLTPRELDARMDPWHGYGADCPDDQYYGR